jgi:SAM-dependent methyltransferase
MIQNMFLKLEPFMQRLYFKLRYISSPNLRGDRDVEFSWVAANLPLGPGKALDFGCGVSYLAFIAARKGFDTIAIDLLPVHWFYNLPNLHFIQGDIFISEFEADSFDVIINCSSIEHVGLVGRYSVVQKRPDGDIEAMDMMARLLKPGGTMLLTIPVGRDAVFAPLHRVYGENRMSKLLASYVIEKEEYWEKDEFNKWQLVEKRKAIDSEPKQGLYGLGCFILHPSK